MENKDSESSLPSTPPIEGGVTYAPATAAIVAVPTVAAPVNETWGQWLRRYLESWTDWLKQNFDKLLLLGLVLWLLRTLDHAAHTASDIDNVHWYREVTNTALGTLLGLITGARLGMALAAKTDKSEPKETKS